MGYDPNQPYGQQPNPYGQSPNPYGQPPNVYGGQPPTQYNPPLPEYQQAPPPYGQPPMYGGAPPVPPISYGPPPKKSSLRWLWITLAIVGGLLVLTCGGCAIASVAGIGFFAKTAVGPTTAANAYYQSIKDQNYGQAYSYLTSNMTTTQGQQLTSTLYAQLAQAEDTVNGRVTTFSQTGINVSSSNGVDTATVTMSVTRNGSPYSVTLQLQDENGTWKITSYNTI